MTGVVLVRHGESLWHLEGRVQGQSGGGLSEAGRVQADHTARFVAGEFPGALVVASDLRRGRDSAAPLWGLTGQPERVDAGLRERDFGTWTDRSTSQIACEEPERWARWRRDRDIAADLGGEDTAALVARVAATLWRLVDEAGDRPLVCVTHGGPIWHGAQHLLGARENLLGGVATASVSELEVDAAGTRGGRTRTVRLRSWNQVAHLPPEVRACGPRYPGL